MLGFTSAVGVKITDFFLLPARYRDSIAIPGIAIESLGIVFTDSTLSVVFL